MLEIMGEAQCLALVGLAGGIVLGLAARLGRFCTLGAIEDYFYGDSTLRARMWLMAAGVAIAGSFAAMGAGLVDPRATVYLGQGWNLAGSVIGGLIFGYGMALAGNCGYGALARLGGGDMRSFVIVLVMGLSAYATLSGPLARLRVTLFPVAESPAEIPGIAHLVARATGLPATAVGLAVGLGLILVALLLGPAKGLPRAMAWAAAAGLAIVSGWIGTDWVAREGFAAVAVQSHTFSAPLGESMIYLMTSSGNTLSFGVGSVAGVLAGAFVGSLFKGHFRWEACEDPRELRRQIVGAALMGVGGVTAVGCSIGQGLSALSLLAFSAPVTLAAIILGAIVGLRQLIVGLAPAE